MPGGTPESLGGFVWWFVVGVYFLAVGLAVFVVADSLRAVRRPRLDALRGPWWLFAATAAGYLVFVLVAWIRMPASLRWIDAIPVVLTPVALAVEVAYLLRVVFPKASAAAAPAREQQPLPGLDDEDRAPADETPPSAPAG